MNLGVALPNALPYGLNRELLIQWARMAEEAGFWLLGTLDRPTYDSWDSLTTLAAIASVTSRIGLATTILQLPNRNEVLVAKQAAVVDQLSEGRFILGLGLGSRVDDYEIFGVPMRERGKTLERQVANVRRIWAEARESSECTGRIGPAPFQKDGPPIWFGGHTQRALERAVELADGFIFGAGVEPHVVMKTTAWLRARAAERGKHAFTCVAAPYCAFGEDAGLALARATEQLRRYYPSIPADPAKLVINGPAEAIKEAALEYEEAGLDGLVLVPQILDLQQLEALATDVLPAFQARN